MTLLKEIVQIKQHEIDREGMAVISLWDRLKKKDWFKEVFPMVRRMRRTRKPPSQRRIDKIRDTIQSCDLVLLPVYDGWELICKDEIKRWELFGLFSYCKKRLRRIQDDDVWVFGSYDPPRIKIKFPTNNDNDLGFWECLTRWREELKAASLLEGEL